MDQEGRIRVMSIIAELKSLGLMESAKAVEDEFIKILKERADKMGFEGKWLELEEYLCSIANLEPEASFSLRRMHTLVILKTGVRMNAIRFFCTNMKPLWNNSVFADELDELWQNLKALFDSDFETYMEQSRQSTLNKLDEFFIKVAALGTPVATQRTPTTVSTIESTSTADVIICQKMKLIVEDLRNLHMLESLNTILIEQERKITLKEVKAFVKKIAMNIPVATAQDALVLPVQVATAQDAPVLPVQVATAQDAPVRQVHGDHNTSRRITRNMTRTAQN